MGKVQHFLIALLLVSFIGVPASAKPDTDDSTVMMLKQDSIVFLLSMAKDDHAKAELLYDLSFLLSDLDSTISVLKLAEANIEKSTADTLLPQIYTKLGLTYDQLSDNPHAIQYERKAKNYWQKHRNKEEVMHADQQLGISYFKVQEYDSARACLENALLMAKTYDDKLAESDIYFTFGYLESAQNKHYDAITCFMNSSIAALKANDSALFLQGQVCAANEYFSISQYDSAFSTYKRVIDLAQDFRPHLAATSKYNLAVLYQRNKENDLAEKLLWEVHETCLELADTSFAYKALYLLANYKYKQNDTSQTVRTLLDTSIKYIKRYATPQMTQYLDLGKARRLLSEKDTASVRVLCKQIMASKPAQWDHLLTSQISEVYYQTYRKSDQPKAIEHLHKAHRLFLGRGDMVAGERVVTKLYNHYLTHRNPDSALFYLQLQKVLLDSVSNETKSNEFEKRRMQTEYADQMAAAKKLQFDEHLKAEQHKSKQQKIILGIGACLFITIIFIIFAIRSARKRNQLIEQIEEQKADVEEKNMEITDSINYAKNIQQAILPSSKIITESLPDSFIYYKPKDIIAGDFFWLEPLPAFVDSDSVFFAAADCTGHGVPGAMMSVMCSNALTKSVQENPNRNAGEILDATTKLVEARFSKSEEMVHDGMDVALCKLNKVTRTINYSGAHNPLWIVRKKDAPIEGLQLALSTDTHLLYEVTANKQPIGRYDYRVPYNSHDIQLAAGDTIYIFSDGYADQFGGPRGKKFKSKSFKELILSVQDLPMEEQKQTLHEVFVSWMGATDQVDDVCVIGVKL